MDMTLEALTEKRDELMKRLADIRRDLRSGLDADSKEQAIELENMEVLQEIHRLADEELQNIEQQLAELR